MTKIQNVTIFAMMKSKYMSTNHQNKNRLWFLPVLFFADVSLYNFLSISSNVKFANLVVGLVSLLLGFLFCWKNITMIIDMSAVAIAAFYLSVGYGMKRMFSAETIRNQGSLGLSLLVIGLVIMILTKSNLVLKLNDILPIWKVAFSTMEAMGIMLILSTIAPHFAKVTLRYTLIGIYREEHNGYLCVPHANILL